MSTKAVYAGSFDPLTNGHSWVINQAKELFDEVIVAVAHNPAKHYTFPLETRSQLISLTHPDVEAATIPNEYLARYAKSKGASYLVRGVRSTTDFEYEKTICNVNRSLLEPDIKTVLLIPPKSIEDISSSTVTGMVGPYGWNHVVPQLVPPAVFRALQQHYLEKRTQRHPALEQVITEMSAPWRAYHNLNHLIDMFGALDVVDDEPPAEFTEAILKHDLYDERTDPDAVTKSAETASSPAVKALILATDHAKSHPSSAAEKLMVDLDLSILGSDWYDEYASGIYAEYVTHGTTSPETFRSGRAAVLRRFLSGPIYHTPESIARYEDKARINLQKELATLLS